MVLLCGEIVALIFDPRGRDIKYFSSYCCECYKKYVLIGDKQENLFREIQVEGFVDVEYTDAKDYV